MTTIDQPVRDLDLGLLSAALQGQLFLPGTPGYAERVTGWNVAVRRTPAAIVDVATAGDVSAVVRFAGINGLRVAVGATGHGAFSLDEPHLLINTTLLEECVVYPDGWARVGAGVRWQRVLDAAAPHGLAPLAGSAPNVGVVGYTTGGGYGPLARTLGVASDRVRAIEVVTGDGQARRVTAEDESGLFWALRGGKGALGIVTAIEFDLVRIPSIYAGALYYGGENTSKVLSAWREWAGRLPARATTSLAVLQLPAMPGVPEPLAGRMTVAVRFAWTGDPADGEAVLQPMRAVASTLIDAVNTIPYAALGAIHADPVDPMPVFERTGLLRDLPDEALDVIVAAAGPESRSPQVIVELRQLGGAIACHAAPSAVSNRDAAYSILTIGIDAPGIGEATRAHSEGLLGALSPWLTGGKLVNFAADGSTESAHRAYDSDALSRLGRLAAAYDPHGVLADALPIRRACAGI
ncbi:FAD-binding oxidoreductase [Leifsonia sp. 22587]|uniref:FAD-binding oxidoreductase n=1 Tax=Leifsonia sp. 22587 TaxID=3453946 RepID=UPI003F837AB4